MEDFETKYEIDNKEEANKVEKQLYPKYPTLFVGQNSKVYKSDLDNMKVM